MNSEVRRQFEGALFLAAYIACIPLANWLIQHAGTLCPLDGPCLVPVAPPRRGRRRQAPARAANANPTIVSPMAAIQPPKARIAMPRQAVAGSASARRRASVTAMMSVIAA